MNETESEKLSKDEYRELEQIGGPETRHYRHPTDPLLTWCGRPDPVPSNTFVKSKTSYVEQINCADCLHQYIKKGAAWWWNVHRLWYGTTCHEGQHNCS